MDAIEEVSKIFPNNPHYNKTDSLTSNFTADNRNLQANGIGCRYDGEMGSGHIHVTISLSLPAALSTVLFL